MAEIKTVKRTRKKPLAPELAAVETAPVSVVTVGVPYIRAVGRRKTAAARVRLTEGGEEIIVNGRPLKSYFPSVFHQEMILAPFTLVGKAKAYAVSAKVAGGGLQSQAEAIRHAIARALLSVNADWRKTLKAVGFLRRDPREKERKKFGLKKARRAPQWAKR